MAVRRWSAGLLVALALAALWFFVVYAAHPQSALQEEVKGFLDGAAAELPFSPAANHHLADVRSLFVWARVLSAALIGGALWAASRVKDQVLLPAGSVLVAAPLLLGLFGFDALFAGFHEALFAPGSWVFPADSLLIRTYPRSFFVRFASVWGALCVASGFSLLWSSRSANG